MLRNQGVRVVFRVFWGGILLLAASTVYAQTSGTLTSDTTPARVDSVLTAGSGFSVGTPSGDANHLTNYRFYRCNATGRDIAVDHPHTAALPGCTAIANTSGTTTSVNAFNALTTRPTYTVTADDHNSWIRFGLAVPAAGNPVYLSPSVRVVHAPPVLSIKSGSPVGTNGEAVVGTVLEASGIFEGDDSFGYTLSFARCSSSDAAVALPENVNLLTHFGQADFSSKFSGAAPTGAGCKHIVSANPDTSRDQVLGGALGGLTAFTGSTIPTGAMIPTYTVHANDLGSEIRIVNFDNWLAGTPFTVPAPTVSITDIATYVGGMVNVSISPVAAGTQIFLYLVDENNRSSLDGGADGGYSNTVSISSYDSSTPLPALTIKELANGKQVKVEVRFGNRSFHSELTTHTIEPASCGGDPVPASCRAHVPNRAPTADMPTLGELELVLKSGETVTGSRTAAFSDADSGDTLRYKAASDTPSVATVTPVTFAESAEITVTAVSMGTATISITANDGTDDSPTTQTFSVTVRPEGTRALTVGGTSSQRVAQNAAIETITLTAENLSGEITYTLVEGESGTGNGSATLHNLRVTPTQTGATVSGTPAQTVTFRVRAAPDTGDPVYSTPITVTVTEPTPSAAAPAASSSSSGGIVALALIGAGAYFWWKKRQIANGNAAKMALLPDVSFDLDRNDNRAFYTKLNWQNSGGSNWQLRGNAKIHTKYSGKLLDWHADSHLGYRINGKFGDFNPYAKAKFVQNAPENAKMDETYTVGVNYSVPNRFSVQFLQPDDEIWRYSLKTEMQLPRKIVLKFNQPNSDIWRYSASLNWQISERIGLNLSQSDSDLPNYGFGIQWRNKSKIRYGISGETGSNSYRLSGEFWF